MPTYIVNYSDLVTDDNRSPHLKSIQPPRKFNTHLRARALLPHKFLYATREDVETKIAKLVEKINSLPPGTFFSVGSLARCTGPKGVAIYLGKEMTHRCYPGANYDFITAYTGKWIYQRNKKHLELVNDFEIDLLPILNPPLPKEFS